MKDSNYTVPRKRDSCHALALHACTQIPANHTITLARMDMAAWFRTVHSRPTPMMPQCLITAHGTRHTRRISKYRSTPIICPVLLGSMFWLLHLHHSSSPRSSLHLKMDRLSTVCHPYVLRPHEYETPVCLRPPLLSTRVSPTATRKRAEDHP